MYLWTRLINARAARVLSGSNTHKSILCHLFFFPEYFCKDERQCQAAPVEFGLLHEAICTGLIVNAC
jgi:hypothetical protein